YLTAIAPETGDSEFTWRGYVERNNNELVAAWGNLVNRVISFAVRHWDGRVPEPGPQDARDTELLDQISAGFDTVGAHYARAEFRAALRETMSLAREVNRYLDDKAPWFQIKEDRAAAGTTIYVALRAIDSLATLFAPVPPFTSAEVKRFLGYEDPLFGDLQIERFDESERSHEALVYQPLASEGSVDRWVPSELAPGQPLARPRVLFQKLDESVVDEERARLERASGAATVAEE